MSMNMILDISPLNEVVVNYITKNPDGTTITTPLVVEERYTSQSSDNYKRASRILEQLWSEVDRKNIVKPRVTLINSRTEIGFRTLRTNTNGIRTNRIIITSQAMEAWDDDLLKAVMAHEMGHLEEEIAGRGTLADKLEDKPVKLTNTVITLSILGIVPVLLVGLNSLLVVGTLAAAAFARVGLKYMAKALQRRYEIACDSYSIKYIPKPELIPKYLVQTSVEREVFGNPKMEPSHKRKPLLYLDQLSNSHPNVFKRTLNLVKQTTKAQQAIDLVELRQALSLEDEPWLALRYPEQTRLWEKQVDHIIKKSEKIQRRAGIEAKTKAKVLGVF